MIEADVETTAIGGVATDPLDEVEVLDLSGNAVPISDLWKDRKAVVAFARHFGFFIIVHLKYTTVQSRKLCLI